MFECHGDDGRTYTLRLDDADVAEVARAAEARAARGRTRADDEQVRCELEAKGQARLVG